MLIDFAPDIAADGRRATAERIGRQPDVFASLNEAIAYHGEDDTPAVRARYEAFLKPVANGYQLRRDLHFRDNFRKVLETGRPVPVPDFLWPMLASLKIPTLVIRGSQSNMFDAATLTKVKEVAPLTQTFELQGSHDLAGDNPAGLTKALSEFLVGGRL